MVQIEAACCFHRGFVKDSNEDNFLFADRILEDPAQEFGSREGRFFCGRPVCFAVFDGLGGLPEGETAARMAAQALRGLDGERSAREWPEKIWLEWALRRIHGQIAAYSDRAGHQIGTTAAAVLFRSDGLVTGSVGDSRIYRFRNGRLERLSADHSDRELLTKLGIQGRRPSLLQFLGMPEENGGIRPGAAAWKYAGGRYLLCSDGLTDLVPDDQIERICAEYAAPPACAEQLVQCALERGGTDNVTVLVCAPHCLHGTLRERTAGMIQKIRGR